MAAVPSEITPSTLELRSASLTLMAMVLKTTDLDALAAELDDRVSQMPRLFDDEPVAIDLSRVRDGEAPVDFGVLLALLRRHRMLPVAVRGGSSGQMVAARAAGLAEAPEGGRPLREVAPAEPLVNERVVEVQLPPQPPLIIDRPMRSGQQIYARDRDLVITALVSHGAEVIADGHIHVYGPLRGRALAGAAGNTEARIFTAAMEAQLLAIAGFYRTAEEPLPADVVGRPAMVRLASGSLRVEALPLRP